MTISTETCVATGIGNGSTTEFTYSFLIPYQPDGVTPAVAVYVLVDGVRTDLTLGVDYSIEGTGNPAGGAITYPLTGDPLAAGAIITYGRVADYEQPYAFPNQNLRPSEIEASMDWAMMTIQQLHARIATLEEVMSVNPLPFSFAPVFDAALDEDVEGAEITFMGHSSEPFAISVIDMQYSLNGGEFTSEAGVARVGDKVKPRRHSSVLEATVTEGSLLAGDVTALYTVTTAAAEPPIPVPPEPEDWPSVTATPGTFAAVRAAADAGTIIYLQTGAYGDITINGLNKAAPGIIIRPGVGQSPVIGSLSIFNSSGIWFDNFTGANKIYSTTAKYGVWVRTCARVYFTDCEVKGEVVAAIGLNNMWQGFLMTDGTDYGVSRCLVHDCRIGIGVGRITGWTCEDNEVYRNSSDIIRHTAVINGSIQRNQGFDNYRVGTSHNDFIQFYVTSGPSQNLVIKDNIFRRGNGYACQGIFMRGSATAPYLNVTIERNGMCGAHQYNGIALGFANGCSIIDNFVQAFATGEHTMTRISINDCTGVSLIAGNITSNPVITSARCAPPAVYGVGGVDDNTYNFPKAAEGDYSALDTWISEWA